MPRLYRRVIRIRAEDSPNVQLGMIEQRAGKVPSGRVIVPGVLPWADYVKRRETWDQVQQCIGLDGMFWEGAELLMFPPDWLNRAERYAEAMRGKKRQAKGIGIDPAEGGDRTAMVAVDEMGIVDLASRKTPNTAVITSEALAFMKGHNVPPDRVFFDRGGGGKQHADVLRERGYPVKTVAFGETVIADPRRGTALLKDRQEQRERRYASVNRRAEMYSDLRELLDPSRADKNGAALFFAIPAEMSEIRRQLAPIPMLWDAEGRVRMLPKRKKSALSREQSLEEIIGCSPDEADALVLGVYAMNYRGVVTYAGAI